jgi:hypothetical protein
MPPLFARPSSRCPITTILGVRFRLHASQTADTHTPDAGAPSSSFELSAKHQHVHAHLHLVARGRAYARRRASLSTPLTVTTRSTHTGPCMNMSSSLRLSAILSPSHDHTHHGNHVPLPCCLAQPRRNSRRRGRRGLEPAQARSTDGRMAQHNGAASLKASVATLPLPACLRTSLHRQPHP